MKKLSSSGAFIQWFMPLWLLPYECLLLRMKLMTCNDLRGPTCLWLCSLRLHHRGRYLFRSCPGTFIKTSFHVLTSSNGLCDHHYISAIFCLCDCQFGGLCDLCLHQYVHIDGIRDPVAITRWYTIRNWGRMVFVTSITWLWYYVFVTVFGGLCDLCLH